MDTLVFIPGTQSLGDASAHVTVAARAHGGRDGRRRRPRLVGDPQEGQQGVRRGQGVKDMEVSRQRVLLCALRSQESIRVRVRVGAVGGWRGWGQLWAVITAVM